MSHQHDPSVDQGANRSFGRPSESARTEAFSDGVFSIAVTLLVLELAIPAVQGGFATALLDEWVSYVAYIAAFGAIGVLWMGHHTVFTHIESVDPGLLWRNLVLLFTVSVVPFPTAVIASAYRVGNPADQAAAVVSYAVVGIASGVSWLLLFTYIKGRLARLAPHANPAFFTLRAPLVTIAGYSAAALLGWFVSPGLALAIFVLFPPFYVAQVRADAATREGRP
jgi:uncharacterized membrane protein